MNTITSSEFRIITRAFDFVDLLTAVTACPRFGISFWRFLFTVLCLNKRVIIASMIINIIIRTIQNKNIFHSANNTLLSPGCYISLFLPSWLINIFTYFKTANFWHELSPIPFLLHKVVALTIKRLFTLHNNIFSWNLPLLDKHSYYWY